MDTDEYKAYRASSGDKRLPSNPWAMYKDEYDFGDFFGKLGFYTYAECKAVVQENNVMGNDEYRAYRASSGDKRLHSDPWTKYKDEWDFGDFFGKLGFYTYAECKAVVQENNVKINSEYHAYRASSGDKRLPGEPWTVYKDEWDADDFYGKLYSLEDFREKLSAAGIVKKTHYEEILQPTSSAFSKDPVTHYKFNSFKELVEFEFHDLDKTCEYIQKHKINKSEEYFEHAKENPYLRAHPNKVPGFVGALHYYKKTPFCDFLKKYPAYKPYVDVAEKLCEKGANLTKKAAFCRQFIEFLAEKGAPSQPHEFLHINTQKIDLDIFINGLAKVYRKQNTVAIVVEFIDELLLEYCADVDDGEVVYLPDFRNPYAKHALAIDYKRRKPSETVKHILPFAYIESGRKKLCPALATTFKELTTAIKIYDTDYFEVEESQIDKNDPNCVWRTNELYKKSGRKRETIYEMWSPVRTIAMLTLFELPIRGQQILWNDSGEADSEIPIINSENKIEWVKNPHKLAGQFKESQGFIKRYDDALGFNCTTNKTKGGEGGYSVAYLPEELPFWLIRLRDWQMKYNPIEKTTKWSNHFLGAKVDEKRLKHRGFEGRQCFLFRNPQAQSQVLRAQPLKSVFSNALPILLFNVQEPGNPLAKWIGKGEPSSILNSYTTKFTPHSLRASLITTYIVDHNLNPTLVAKLVGHSNVVMTIYYAKVTEPAMRRELQQAEKRALKGKSQQVLDMLMTNKFEDLTSLFVDNSNGAFLKALSGQLEIGAIVESDLGLCPVGGQSCSEGGEEVAEKARYRLPVPTSSVLGSKNCPQCRFFVTNFSYLGGLKALADQLAHKMNEAKVESDKHQQIVDDLIDERDECETRGESFMRRVELGRAQDAYETASSEFIAIHADLVSTYRISDGAGKLISNQQSHTGAENVPMIANGDIFTIEMEDVSLFEQIDTVCKNAEVFTVGNPKHAIMERTRALDMLFKHNEISASIFNLPQDDQLKIGNHLTTLLVQKLGGWRNLDAVAEGRNQLNDFIELDEIKEIKRTITLLDNPIHCQSLESMGDVA